MITVWGLKTCDTCRKALTWLSSQGVDHRPKDLRADGLPPEELTRWVDRLGWEVLLNKASTTWRNLPDADKQDLSAARAKALMAANPTLIKRPVFVTESDVVVGFRDAQKKALLNLR